MPTLTGPLTSTELRALDEYWRAANYLSVGQIYLLDNPLLREPLRIEHTKPRLLGHWGTTPGLNFIYAHLNRIIRERDLNVLYVAGPGTRRPGRGRERLPGGHLQRGVPADRQRRRGYAAAVSPVLFPGRHPEPRRSGDARLDPRGRRARLLAASRLRRRLRQPRSARAAAWSATARRRPAPLAASWHSNKFLDPVHDGAVLPVLHLNGYKIANPTVLARIPHGELRALLEGYGYAPHFVEGDEPGDDAPADGRHARRGRPARSPRSSARRARTDVRERPRWPMIVLRTPKGWTGPKTVDGLPAEGSFRSHQVPLAGPCRQPGAPRAARAVDALLPTRGAVRRATARCARSWPRSRPDRRRGAWARTRTPTAACCCASWSCRTSATTPSRCPSPTATVSEPTRVLGQLPARRDPC